MTDQEAVLVLCRIYNGLKNPLAIKVIHKAIVALNFKMEIYKFMQEEEYPEYLEMRIDELINQIEAIEGDLNNEEA